MEGLLWFLIFGAFFYFMMRFGCGAHMVHGHGGHGRRANHATSDQRTNPTHEDHSEYTHQTTSREG